MSHRVKCFTGNETTSHHSSLFVFWHSPWVRWESDWRRAGQTKCPKMILHPENIRLLYYCVDREVFTSVLYHEMLDRQYKVRRHISKRSNKANKIKILLKDWLNNNLLLRNICIWLYIISTNFEVFFFTSAKYIAFI